MLRHYVKIFFRNLGRYKLYSVINFASLVLGISFALLVYLFIRIGAPYDSFHENYDSVYQLEGEGPAMDRSYWPGEVLEFAGQEIPGVEEAYTYRHSSLHVRIEEREFEEDIMYATPGFFQVLSFDLVEGSPQNALEQAGGIYLTREKARELFGTDAPVGETLEVYLEGSYRELYVAGIVGEYPAGSTIRPELVISKRFAEDLANCPESEDWICFGSVYVHLSQDAVETVRDRSGSLAEALNSRLGLSGQDRLSSIHLVTPWNTFNYFQNPIIYGIAVLCLLILAISCITYVNNTVAATATRFREIGIRKVMGSDRRGIAFQFMAESVCTVLVAMGLSLAALELLVPVLSPYVDSLIPYDFGLATSPLYRAESLPLLGILALLTALMAGFWPAAVLSRFKPATVLKSSFAVGASPSFSRYLVGFQMVMAMVVFVLVLQTENSLSAMDQDYYHYRSEELVSLPVLEPDDEGVQSSIYPRFREELEQNGLTLPMAGTRSVRHAPDAPPLRVESREYEVDLREVTPGFFDVLGMSIAERNPMLDEPGIRDSAYVVINPVLRDQLGWEDPLGRLLEIQGTPHTVVGVLEEFHGFEGGNQRAPFVFRLIPETSAEQALVNTAGSERSKEQLAGEMEVIREGLMEEDRPLNVETNVSFTGQERIMEWIVGWSLPVVVFALALTFLGLFSLTSFSVTRRLKEISIRKVNGATPGELVRLLGKEYLLLGIAAYLLALPLGYIASNLLVGAFTGVESPGSIFNLSILSLVSLLTFILLCVSYQVWTASNVNPVKYLKEEQ